MLRDGEPTPKSLCGYVGPATRDEYITVFPNLTDLSKSYEVAVADVLHVTDVPESMRPFGAQVLWLRADAQVGFRNVATGRSSVTEAGPGNSMVETRAGRLRMQAPMAIMAYHCTCTECSVCMSHCDNECVSGGNCMYPPHTL